MKSFIEFIKKEFFHIFRDPRTLIILFAMPVIQLLLFGYVVTTDISDAKIAIWDKSKDEISRKLTDKILSSGYFKLASTIESHNEIEKSFKKGDVKQVIIFENNFGKNLKKERVANLQIISDASDPNIAVVLTNYTQAIVKDFIRVNKPFATSPMRIEIKPQMLYNSELKSVYMFVPGIMAMILMLICAMMTSISLTKESEMGSMEILLVSPLRPLQIIVGKVIPYVFLAFLDAVFIIQIGKMVFEVPVIGSEFLLLSVTFIYLLTALSLGIFISTVVNSQLTAMMISAVALVLPTMLLSGFIFPIDNMPVILQILSNIVPAKWFLICAKDIMLKGSGIGLIWKEVLVLSIMTIVLLAISIKRFKSRLE